MPLLPLIGHHPLRERLAAQWRAGRLPSSILLHGPEGVGKQRLALWLGQMMLCTGDEQPCGECQGCRYTLEGIITGSSTGRALLDARQRYIREIAAMGPEDLKTVAQFDLLGDPSVVPVTTPGRVIPGGKGLPQASLAQRRTVLRATGRALDQTVPRATGRPVRGVAITGAQLAREAGLPAHASTGAVATYGERRGRPRVGFRFHVVPVRVDGRAGLVVAREAGGQRSTTTIWRR